MLYQKFQVDIYSKGNILRKIELDLDIELRDENAKKSAIYDALNVIIGSFYAEDLMTSMGKENFKQSFIKYTAKKHSITIDEVYILGLKFVDELMIDKGWSGTPGNERWSGVVRVSINKWRVKKNKNKNLNQKYLL